MKRILQYTLCMALFVFVSSTVTAQVIVADSFDTYGMNIDLNGQGDWLASTNDAFTVTTDEVLLAEDNQRLILAGGNEFNLMPGDMVQITIDHRVTMAPPSGPVNFSLFFAGVQTSTNLSGVGGADDMSCRVAYNNYENGALVYCSDNDFWWDSNVSPNFRADAYNHCGFDHKPNVGVTADPDSDPLRLVYSLTKSHVTNEFDSSVEFMNLATNLTGSASKSSISRPNVWAASDLTFFVNSLDNANGPNAPYIDAVTVEIVAPSAAPTGLSGLGLQNKVLLTWDIAAGAAEYDVFRSETDGVFNDPAIARATGDSYEDTTVVNGTTYYYVIQAVYYNGNSANSAQASAQPRDVYNDELVILSDFSSEIPGDLAGQLPWKAISGSGSNAFNVIAGPPTAADTVSAEANFALTNGNAVIVDRSLSNDKDDAIEGWFDVVVSSTPSGGVANAFADMGNQAVMDFGLTGSDSEALRAEGKAIMALLTLHIRFEGNLFVGFGTTANDNPDNRLAYIGRNDAGWNPNDGAWDYVEGTPADLETDPLRVEFKIRKTRDEGVYQAWASISNLLTGVTTAFDGPEYVTINRQDLYDMPASLFAVGHSDRSREIQGGTRVRDSIHHVTVREVSVTHTVDNTPEVLPPMITSLTRGDREVSFSWDPVLDATGGYTIILETPNGEVYTIADGTNVTSFVDSPRWNDISNNYTLQANFDNDVTPSVASTNFDAAPVGLIPIYSIGSGEWTDGSVVNASLAGLTTNSGVRYVDYMTTPAFVNGVDGYTGPTLHGLFQGAATGTSMELATEASKTKYAHGGWGNWGEHLTFATLSDLGHATGSIDATSTQLFYSLRAGSWSWGEWNFDFRAVIRNGTDWYVSQSSLPRGGSGGEDKVFTFPNILDETWLTLTADPGTPLLIGVPVDNSTLTDVNAVGWYFDQMVNSSVYEFDVKVSGALPSYDYWADSMGLVSTNNARTDDPDVDGLENEREFALGGNPLVADTATLPTMEVMGAPGSEFIRYIYQEQRDPEAGIEYVMKSTTDLINGDGNSNDGIWSTNNHTSAEGVADYHWMNVTNDVPFGTGINETFIDLEIQ